MKPELLIDDILEMPLAERMRLVEAIWDSIAAAPDKIPLADWQREELERSLADLEANPGDSVTLEEAFDRLRTK